MGFLNEDEKTPEEKLVDELVGSGLQIKGKVREDVPPDMQRLIKSNIKKAWTDNASCEEIEQIYYESVENALNSEMSKIDNQNKITKKISGIGTTTMDELKKLDFNFENINSIKNSTWGKLKNGTIAKKLNKRDNKPFANIFNKKNHTIGINKDNNFYNTFNNKDSSVEVNEEESFESESFKSQYFDEEQNQIIKAEKLVDKLVGIGSSFGEDLNSIDILNSYKFGIKVAVQLIWKNKGSCEEIQKAYDNLVISYLNDKKRREEEQRLKRESAEFKRELRKKRIKRELENRKFILEGYIKEKREGFTGSNNDEFQCVVILEKDMIVIEKKSMLGKLLGEKKILFSDILTVDYDKSRISSTDCIQIHMKGFIFTIRNRNKDNSLKHFYNKFVERTHNQKLSNVRSYSKANNGSVSNADELMKWYKLQEEGVITPKEFEKKKNELL